MKKKNKIIFIVGPTGVGKTSLALELAERFPGEIISSDSMQGYKCMDVMSQKPTVSQRERVPHHLVDFLDIREEYSAAKFAAKAARLIDEIIERKRTPIIVGGSGLYIKALVDGLFPSPEKNTALRRRLEEQARLYGTGQLHNRLRSIDAKAAAGIHPNDLRRVIRALEVFLLTGKPVSEHKKKTKGLKDKYDTTIYGLIRPRASLYERIGRRVDDMVADGLVPEVASIKEKGPSMTAKASLGYKEFCGYLDKKYSLEEAKELLKKNTRRLAKKQMTWFRADKRIKWIDIEGTPLKDAVELIITGLSCEAVRHARTHCHSEPLRFASLKRKLRNGEESYSVTR